MGQCRCQTCSAELHILEGCFDTHRTLGFQPPAAGGVVGVSPKGLARPISPIRERTVTELMTLLISRPSSRISLWTRQASHESQGRTPASGGVRQRR